MTVARITPKEISADRGSTRPSTVARTGSNAANWLVKPNAANYSSPNMYSPFCREQKNHRPSIIELLIAKHKSSAAKIRQNEPKKVNSVRPGTVASPRMLINSSGKVPDFLRESDDRSTKETPKVALHLAKSSSFEVLEQFVLGGEIGKGAYATVRAAHDKENNKKVAIKVYDKFKLITPSRKKNAEREIRILTKLDHPNIVRLFKTVENQKSLNLVLEYVSGCSLMTFLKKKHGKRVDEAEARKIFHQIMSALDYCHSQGITHRDIKMENILIDPQNSIKIIDFGFSTCFPNDKKIKLFCGTPSYMAPEIVNKEECFGPPADIWAAGVVLYVLLTGGFPFRAAHSRELYYKIQKGSFGIPNSVSRDASALIQKMLSFDPIKRPSAKEVLESEWMKEKNAQNRFFMTGTREIPQVRVSLNNTFDIGGLH
jgi:serine/threonine protein kinase